MSGPLETSCWLLAQNNFKHSREDHNHKRKPRMMHRILTRDPEYGDGFWFPYQFPADEIEQVGG